MVGLLLICLSVIALNYFKSDKTEKGENAEAKESKIPEVDEYGGIHLEKVGDKVRQKNWGTFRLLETKSINEAFELAPMVITVKDIRRIQLSSLTDEAKEELKSYTGLSFERPIRYIIKRIYPWRKSINGRCCLKRISMKRFLI